MFELPAQVNGWSITIPNDLHQLEEQPELFAASKGQEKLTLRRVLLAPTIKVSSPPTAEKKATEMLSGGIAEWRLHYRGYDILRGRTIEQLLTKAKRFMEKT